MLVDVMITLTSGLDDSGADGLLVRAAETAVQHAMRCGCALPKMRIAPLEGRFSVAVKCMLQP